MSANKTRPGDASVAAYLASIDDEVRRRDCEALIGIMSKASGEPPRLWGDAIVGFGEYHYRYDSGREGDMFRTGFASRKRDLAVYLVASGQGQAERLATLGRHKMGKACLSLRRLADVDLGVLTDLIEASLAEVARRHG